jgi:hypothetical protein
MTAALTYNTAGTDHVAVLRHDVTWMIYPLAAACVAIMLTLAMPVPFGAASSAEMIIAAAPFGM